MNPSTKPLRAPIATRKENQTQILSQPKPVGPFAQWYKHLRELPGKNVVVRLEDGSAICGKLLFISPDHLNCAIENDDGVHTIKGVSIITSVG